MAAYLQTYLVDTILDDTVSLLASALSVLPVSGNLVLNAPFPDGSCFGGSYWYSFVCCNSEMPNADKTTGVPSADFVLYVTARPTGGSTLAWALTCQSDQYRRPTAGHANFSPARISTSADDYEVQLSTAWHEIVHALGFSSSKFGDFRVPGDITQTEAYSNIVRTFTERGKAVSKIVTPNVVTKVREQYGCTDPWPSAGWELEDYGGSGTAGSHWEKRLGFNEVMTGTADPSSVYSAITYALLEDSGWYSVDYSHAQPLPWGAGEGCSFPQLACSSWSDRYFCSSSSQEGCTVDYRYKAICNAIAYGAALPSYAQYFAQNNLGGQNPYVDYCPYYERLGNGDCQAGSTPTYWFWGEQSGPNSKCVTGTWRSSASSVPIQNHNGCVQTTCTPTQQLQIVLDDLTPLTVTCPFAGGPLDLASVPANSDGRFEGVLNCPPSSLFCTGDPCDTITCDGRGTCDSATATCSCQAGFYGDTPQQCNKRTCPSVSGVECSNQGTCNTNTGICACAAGYYSSACELQGCPHYGFLSSPAAADSVAQCPGGNCQCTNRGTCNNGAGTCSCNTGYWGDGCQFLSCPAAAAATITTTTWVDVNGTRMNETTTTRTEAIAVALAGPALPPSSVVSSSPIPGSNATQVTNTTTVRSPSVECRGADSKNTYGECGGNEGICHCADILDFDSGLPAHSSGAACQNYILTARPYTQLNFVNEAIPGGNGSVYEPVVSRSKAEQYQYFAFDAPEPDTALEIELRVLGFYNETRDNGENIVSTSTGISNENATWSIPQLTVVYETDGQPTRANAELEGLVAFSVNNERTLKTLRLDVLGSQPFYSSSGRIHVGVLAADDDLVYSLSLLRDGCAVVSCNLGSCSNGFCTCPRYAEDASEGLTGTYGFSGGRCAVADCPGAPDCGGAGRGTCVAPNLALGETFRPYCRCEGIYGGSACQRYNVAPGIVVPGDPTTEVSSPSATVVVGFQSDTGSASALGVPPNATAPTAPVTRHTYVADYSGEAGNVNVSTPFLLDVQQIRSQYPQLTLPMGLHIVLNATGSPLSDPVLMLQRDAVPSLSSFQHFDVGAWGQGSKRQELSITIRDDSSLRFVGVLNGRYGQQALRYDLHLELSTGCAPALNGCSGHGQCGTNSKQCDCDWGWEGPACSIPVRVMNASVPLTSAALQPGQWEYFGIAIPAAVRELRVRSTRTLGTNASSSLLVASVFDNLNAASTIPKLTGSTVNFNLNQFVARSAQQNLWLRRPTDLAASQVLFIGVLNTLKAKSAAALQLQVDFFTSDHIPANCLNAGELEACNDQYCSGRGSIITDRGARVCQCEFGWGQQGFCSGPRFSAFETLAASAQEISFLCSVCSNQVNMTTNSMRLMKVAQPLQKSTGLFLQVYPMATAEANTARRLQIDQSPLGVLNTTTGGAADGVGNPSILVSETLPRSLSDFIFVSSSSAANESLLLSEPSRTGTYWVAVYANSGGSFNISASRQQLSSTDVEEEDPLGAFVDFLLNDTSGHVIIGFFAVLVLGITACCVCSFCCGEGLARKLLGDEEQLRKEKAKFDKSMRNLDDDPAVQLPPYLLAQRKRAAKRRWSKLATAIKVGAMAKGPAKLQRLPVRAMPQGSIPLPPPPRNGQQAAPSPAGGGAGGLMSRLKAAGLTSGGGAAASPPPPGQGSANPPRAPGLDAKLGAQVAGFGPSYRAGRMQGTQAGAGASKKKLTTAQLMQMSARK